MGGGKRRGATRKKGGEARSGLKYNRWSDPDWALTCQGNRDHDNNVRWNFQGKSQRIKREKGKPNSRLGGTPIKKRTWCALLHKGEKEKKLNPREKDKSVREDEGDSLFSLERAGGESRRQGEGKEPELTCSLVAHSGMRESQYRESEKERQGRAQKK